MSAASSIPWYIYIYRRDLRCRVTWDVINVVLRHEEEEEEEECVVKIHDYGERVAITCVNRFSRDRLCCTAERFSNSKHRSLLNSVWIKVLNIERCVVASSRGEEKKEEGGIVSQRLQVSVSWPDSHARYLATDIRGIRNRARNYITGK